MLSSRRNRIVLGILLFLLVVRLVLPYGIRALIEGQASAALGRPVVVDDVSLALSRGQASLEGIRIGDADAPLLRVARIAANLDVLGLLGGEIRLETADLVEPKAVVRLLADGTIEPIILAASKPPEPDTGTETEELAAPDEEGGWPFLIGELDLEALSIVLVPADQAGASPSELSLGRVALGDFSIVDGRVDFGSIGIDRPRVSFPRDLEIAPAPQDAAPSEAAPTSGGGLSISGNDFTIEDARFVIAVAGEEVELHLEVSLRDVKTGQGETFPVKLRIAREKGWLELDGDVGVQPPTLRGKLTLEGVSLINALVLADPDAAARVHKGTLGGELALDVGLEQDGVRLALDGGLSLDGLEFDAEGRQVTAGATRLAVADFGLRPAAGGASAVTAERVTLEIDGFGFHDSTVDPTAIVELLEIRMKAGDVRWPESDLELDVSFRGFGELGGTATGRLDAGAGRSEIAVTTLPLTPFSGYARAGGFLLQSGDAHLEGGIDSKGTQHDARFDLVLDGLEIETIDAGAFEKLLGMSPDLALAVLEDPSGSMRLPLNAQVDTAGETEFSVAQLLSGALRQAVTGIVTMPLKGLGSVARGVVGEQGELQMQPIAFEPGDSDWIEGEDDYLAAIARTLVARPAVGVKIIGRAQEDEARRPERLAEKRAKAVARALEKAGVDPEAIEVAPTATGEPGVVVEIVPRSR